MSAESSAAGPAARKPAKAASLLASDLTIEGNLASEGDLHIDGAVRGDVKAPRLTLGESGRIEGDIEAGQFDVRGTVTGSITAGQVRLFASSQVEGDISHEQLTIEAGAVFQGRSLRLQRPASADVVNLAAAVQQG